MRACACIIRPPPAYSTPWPDGSSTAKKDPPWYRLSRWSAQGPGSCTYPPSRGVPLRVTVIQAAVSMRLVLRFTIGAQRHQLDYFGVAPRSG